MLGLDRLILKHRRDYLCDDPDNDHADDLGNDRGGDLCGDDLGVKETKEIYRKRCKTKKTGKQKKVCKVLFSQK